MWPSFLVCLLTTGLIAWLTWLIVPPGFFKLMFVGLAGALWLCQGLRWSYRYFGYTYRMTTRRLFCNRGFRYSQRDVIELAAVGSVLVRRNWFERLAGVGQVLVLPQDPRCNLLILQGIRHPLRAAENIRLAVKKAQEARTDTESVGK
jgi:hypothetical protein